MKEFLPISQEDINARGWEQIDFLFISGDATVVSARLAQAEKF